MKKTVYILAIGVVSLIWQYSYGQQTNTDSLINLIRADKQDTNKVMHVYQLYREYIKTGIYDKALQYCSEALRLSDVILKETKDPRVKLLAQKGIITAYNNMGIAYKDQGNYPKALDHYLKALKVAEELQDKNNISRVLGNIGLVYSDQGEYAKALDYYFKALKIAEEIGDMNGIPSKLGNIGIVYYLQKNYQKALDYYLRSLKIAEETGNKTSIAIRLGNIGIVYFDQKEYSKALDYYLKALRIKEELGDKKEMGITYGNIGALYTETKNYKEAEKFLLDGLQISKEIGDLNTERQVEEYLSKLYAEINSYQLALEHYKKAIVLKDTLFNQERSKELTRKEMNYEFDKKEAATKAEQEKKDAVTKIIIYSVSTGFALVFLLAGFIFRGYRQKQKANLIISEQKQVVEEKQKEILDSIQYAKRIQQSLMPTEKYIHKAIAALRK